MSSQPSSQPIEFEPSWLQKHKVLVICVAVAAAFAGAVAWFVLFVFSMVGNSGPAQLAVQTASENPAVIERLGQPITKGRFISGSIETTGSSGKAELAIPVSGPKGAGTLYVQAHKRAGLWELDLLQFGPKNSDERVDLLPPASSQPATIHTDQQ